MSSLLVIFVGIRKQVNFIEKPTLRVSVSLEFIRPWFIPSGGPNLWWQAGCWVDRGVDWLGQLPQGDIPGQTVHLIIRGPR